MKNIKCRIVVMATTLALAAPLARADTLGDTLAFAYENSGLLEQNRALLRVADEDVAVATANLLPIINWAATATINEPRLPTTSYVTSQLSISAELLLFDFGASRYAIDSQKEVVLATRESLVNVEQQVLLRAVQAYQNVRTTQEVVILRQNNVRVISQELRAAQDRFDVGEVTRTDVSLAESSLALARSQLAAAEGDRMQAVEEFRVAVGRPPRNLQPAPIAPLSRNVEQAKAYAVRNHPLVLAAQRNVSAAELLILRAEAAMKATVTLNGRVGVNDDLVGATQLGVTVAGPIYQGGRLSALARQAMARRDAQRAGLHTTSQNVEQTVGNAYALLDVARARRDASGRQVSAARQAFEGVREEATLGARTTLDVLNAEQTQLDAQANLITARADEVTASYAVLSSMGLLTAARLGLPVQVYDPAAYYNLVRDNPTVMSPQGRALDRVLQAIGKE